MTKGLRVGDAGHTIFGPKQADGSMPVVIANVRDREYAKVLAAAPELAEALSEIFQHCVLVHKHWGDGSNQREADAAIAKGRAALEKAGMALEPQWP